MPLINSGCRKILRLIVRNVVTIGCSQRQVPSLRRMPLFYSRRLHGNERHQNAFGPISGPRRELSPEARLPFGKSSPYICGHAENAIITIGGPHGHRPPHQRLPLLHARGRKVLRLVQRGVVAIRTPVRDLDGRMRQPRRGGCPNDACKIDWPNVLRVMNARHGLALHERLHEPSSRMLEGQTLLKWHTALTTPAPTRRLRTERTPATHDTAPWPDTPMQTAVAALRGRMLFHDDARHGVRDQDVARLLTPGVLQEMH
mgnify:CR=1 FL=1